MNETGQLTQKLARLDVTVPNVARIYDYFLGGKDHFATDREAAEELRALLPDAALACRQNREFLRRAVRYLAGEAGIGQFIDIGSGLPTAENTHKIAQAIRPDARVVYVDNDHSKSGCAHTAGSPRGCPVVSSRSPPRIIAMLCSDSSGIIVCCEREEEAGEGCCQAAAAQGIGEDGNSADGQGPATAAEGD